MSVYLVAAGKMRPGSYVLPERRQTGLLFVDVYTYIYIYTYVYMYICIHIYV